MALLLERNDHLVTLGRLAEQTKSGRGCFVAVAGEAGIGKSVLASAFIESMANDFEVLVGACDALHTPRPLGPLVDVAATNPELGEFLGASDAMVPADVYRQVLDWMTSRSRPVLFLVEDVHWADDATNDLLRFLGRRLQTSALMVVITHRNDELGRDHPLRVVLADIPKVNRISVEPLSVAAVQQLIDAATVTDAASAADTAAPDAVAHDAETGDAETLHRMTGGNAFFVTEVLAGGDQISDNIYDAVLARLARIPARSRRLVDLVAVSPSAVDLDTAIRLADANVVDTQLAIDQGVLVAEKNRLRFRHELARDAVYTSMAEIDRVQHHRRFLDWELSSAEPEPARITHHATAAGDVDAVLTWAPQAAASAEARRSHREAVDFHSAVVEVASGAKLAGALCSRSEQYRLLGHADASLVDAEQAVAHARQTDDLDLLGRTLIQLSSSLASNNQTAGADPVLVEAIETLEGSGSDERLASAAFQYAFNAMLARRRSDCWARLAIAEDLAARVESDELMFRCRLLHAYIRLITGGEDRGIGELHELEQEVGANRDALPFSFLSNVGSAFGEIRRYPDATRYLEEAIEVGRRYDEDFGIGYASAWLARICFETGDYDRAASLAATVLDRPTLTYARVTAAGVLGRTRVRRGDPDGARLLSESLEAIKGTWLQQRWPLVAGLAEHHWLNGDHEAARAVLSEPYADVLRTDSPWGRGELAFWWSMTSGPGSDSAISGDGDGGAEGYGEVVDNVAEPYALHLAGRWSDAATSWAAIGCPYEQALALSFGDETMMFEGLEILYSLQANPTASWLRSRLRAAGATSIPRGPQSSTRGSRFGLTARQMDVVELVAAGLSNNEIATRLFISKRTVEHHVSAIMNKLGVRARAEVVAKVLGDE